MSLVTLPFYQKRHKHFDQSYRNIQTRYLLDEYAAKKRTSTRSSSQKTVAQKSSSQRASSQTAEGATTCRICAKRVSAALEEEEAQETKRRYRSLVAAYGEAKRERFLRELAQLEEDVHLARSHARDELDRYALQHMVDDRLAWDRPSYEERLSRAPEILVRLRSHTVWERMPVKLCFTVQGFPTPVVQWYKDGSLICQAGEPGKYRIESKYGVHTLEINSFYVSVGNDRGFEPARPQETETAGGVSFLLRRAWRLRSLASIRGMWERKFPRPAFLPIGLPALGRSEQMKCGYFSEKEPGGAYKLQLISAVHSKLLSFHHLIRAG